MNIFDILVSQCMQFYILYHTLALFYRAFGVLKQRWRVIDHTGGRLCYTPLKACKIAMCCFILHNLCRKHKMPMMHERTPLPAAIEIAPIEEDTEGADSQGRSVRAAIVASFA